MQTQILSRLSYSLLCPTGVLLTVWPHADPAVGLALRSRRCGWRAKRMERGCSTLERGKVVWK